MCPNVTEESGVFRAVRRVEQEITDCSSIVGTSVTGVRRSLGRNIAETGALSPEEAAAEETLGLNAPIEDGAGGIELMAASRPQPGALNLETPGCPRSLPLSRVSRFPRFLKLSL